MLRRNKRIQGKDHVLRIVKGPSIASNAFFVAKSTPNAYGHNRYALVLSKKIERSAVKRNRKRRQMYEIIHQLEQEGVIKPDSSDIILLSKHPVKDSDFSTLKSACASLFNHNA